MQGKDVHETGTVKSSAPAPKHGPRRLPASLLLAHGPDRTVENNQHESTMNTGLPPGLSEVEVAGEEDHAELLAYSIVASPPQAHAPRRVDPQNQPGGGGQATHKGSLHPNAPTGAGRGNLGEAGWGRREPTDCGKWNNGVLAARTRTLTLTRTHAAMMTPPYKKERCGPHL